MSLTKVSYSMIAGAVVNVLDFGAIGDGVTDDTNAILEACQTGRKLYWPAGTYLVTSPINYNNFFAAGNVIEDIYWQGDGGFGATTIQYTGSGTFFTAGLSPSYFPALHLKDMDLFGNGVIGHTSTTYAGYTTTTSANAGSTSTQTGILLSAFGVPNSIIENVRMKFWNIALHTNNFVYGISLRNSTLQANNIGWKLGGTTTASSIERCEVAGCAVGVWLAGEGIENIQISGNAFESNTAGAAILSTGSSTTIVINDNYITNNINDFIHIGYNPTTAPLNGFLNFLEFYNNYGGSLVLGDTVRIVNIYRNALDSTASYSVKNEYTHQPLGTVRLINEWDNYDAFGANPYSPYVKFNGTNASEIVHYNPGTRAWRSTALSLVTAVDTVIPLDSETYDDASWHSTSVNTSRITVDRYGNYTISGSASFNNTSATGVRSLSIRLNGTTVIANSSTAGSTAFSPAVNISTIYKLSPADYVELVALQASGGALDILAGAGNYPNFSVQLC